MRSSRINAPSGVPSMSRREKPTADGKPSGGPQERRRGTAGGGRQTSRMSTSRHRRRRRVRRTNRDRGRERAVKPALPRNHCQSPRGSATTAAGTPASWAAVAASSSKSLSGTVIAPRPCRTCFLSVLRGPPAASVLAVSRSATLAPRPDPQYVSIALTQSAPAPDAGPRDGSCAGIAGTCPGAGWSRKSGSSSRSRWAPPACAHCCTCSPTSPTGRRSRHRARCSTASRHPAVPGSTWGCRSPTSPSAWYRCCWWPTC